MQLCNINSSMLISLLGKKSRFDFVSIYQKRLLQKNFDEKLQQSCFFCRYHARTFARKQEHFYRRTKSYPSRSISFLHSRRQCREVKDTASVWNNCDKFTVGDKQYAKDEWTNVTTHILSYLGRNLHLKKDHPIALIKEVGLYSLNKNLDLLYLFYRITF